MMAVNWPDDGVQSWSKHAKELKQSHISKAQKLVEYDCIRYVGSENEYGQKSSFVCLPLNTHELVLDDETGRMFTKVPYKSDYNSTIYTITRNSSGWSCNCQGWTYRERQGGGLDGCSCSHVLALFLCFKLGRFRK